MLNGVLHDRGSKASALHLIERVAREIPAADRRRGIRSRRHGQRRSSPTYRRRCAYGVVDQAATAPCSKAVA